MMETSLRLMFEEILDPGATLSSTRSMSRNDRSYLWREGVNERDGKGGFFLQDLPDLIHASMTVHLTHLVVYVVTCFGSQLDCSIRLRAYLFPRLRRV